MRIRRWWHCTAWGVSAGRGRGRSGGRGGGRAGLEGPGSREGVQACVFVPKCPCGLSLLRGFEGRRRGRSLSASGRSLVLRGPSPPAGPALPTWRRPLPSLRTSLALLPAASLLHSLIHSVIHLFTHSFRPSVSAPWVLRRLSTEQCLRAPRGRVRQQRTEEGARAFLMVTRA